MKNSRPFKGYITKKTNIYGNCIKYRRNAYPVKQPKDVKDLLLWMYKKYLWELKHGLTEVK